MKAETDLDSSRNNIIVSNSIAEAWFTAMTKLFAAKRNEIPNLLLQIHANSLDSELNKELVSRLDKLLVKHGNNKLHTTAGTIFPDSLWNPKAERDLLYSRYLAIRPAIRKFPANIHGVYFERMIAYGLTNNQKQLDGNAVAQLTAEGTVLNQLEFIVGNYVGSGAQKPNHRRSALILSIFNPLLDHVNVPRRGFPCLQQVSFVPDRNCLRVNAFYATQFIFDRGFGNYLGLLSLGRFVAYYLGIQSVELNCYAGIAQLGEKITARELGSLEKLCS